MTHVFFFQVVQGNDCIVQNGITTNISTRHQCITVMSSYDKKSIEVGFIDNQPSIWSKQGFPAISFWSTNIFTSIHMFGGMVRHPKVPWHKADRPCLNYLRAWTYGMVFIMIWYLSWYYNYFLTYWISCRCSKVFLFVLNTGVGRHTEDQYFPPNTRTKVLMAVWIIELFHFIFL